MIALMIADKIKQFFFLEESKLPFLPPISVLPLCSQSAQQFQPEHVSEAERCDAQLNYPLCGRALRSVAHGQSKHSANVPLMLSGKPNPTQIML